jgi:hypothetical protein
MQINERSGVKVKDQTKLLNLKNDDSAACILSGAVSLPPHQNLGRILICE